MTESTLSWLQRVWENLRLSIRLFPRRYLIEHQMVMPRLKGVSLRQYTDDDFEVCRSLCELNAPGRLPKNTVYDQVSFLRHPSRTNLIAELHGQVIGCGGYLLLHPDFACLAYGLVHPDYQQLGVGRLLLFARIAQLPEVEGDTFLLINTVEKACRYYEQFGFIRQAEPWKDGAGGEHPRAVTAINTHIIHTARRYLQALGISCPDLRHIPPMHPHLVRDSVPMQATESIASVYEH